MHDWSGHMELKLQNIIKKYNDKIVVDNISIKLNRGIYGLLGPNGAGKSTLIRMICGIETPDSGEIICNGSEIISLGKKYREILGYVPQKVGYYPDFTAEKFLMYMANVKGINRDYARQEVNKVLELTGLANTGKKRIRNFSGGMRQRLGIAQSLLNKPQILILDEPTTGLDLKERMNFKQFISEYASDRIIIFATHIVSDIEDIGNEIIIFKEGKVQLCGEPEKLLSSINGKVWELNCTKQGAELYRKKYKISNMKLNGEHVNLRVVSDEKPDKEAILKKENLQDLYLYLFGELPEE